jgi:Uri superfamily endonuclease
MEGGTYSLLVKLPEGREIVVGGKRQGFPAGYYVYVGSAMGGLEQRVRRHLSGEKKRKWHVDFLLEHGKIVDLGRIHSKRRLECELASGVRESGGSPVKGFGASDCGCDTHLYYFSEVPREGIRVKVG